MQSGSTLLHASLSEIEREIDGPEEIRGARRRESKDTSQGAQDALHEACASFLANATPAVPAHSEALTACREGTCGQPGLAGLARRVWGVTAHGIARDLVQSGELRVAAYLAICLTPEWRLPVSARTHLVLMRQG